MRKEISRRDFMKGTAAGAIGIAAAGVLGACQQDTAVTTAAETTEGATTAAATAAASTEAATTLAETEAEATTMADAVSSEDFVMTAEYAEKKWSFEIPPEPVDESEIKETYEADVIVIGGGCSGLCCALSAIENGAEVILFAASSDHVERGGSNHGINTKTQNDRNISYKPEDLAHRIKQEFVAGSYYVDQKKWSKWLQNNTESMNWLIEKMESYGAEVTLEREYQDRDGVFDFVPASHNFIYPADKGPSDVFPEEHMNSFGAALGQALVNDMYVKEITDKGGTIHWNTIAQYLIREDNNKGRVSAVVAINENGEYVKYVGKKGIVMATGDFSQNKEMMAKYCPGSLDILGDYDVNYDAKFQFGGLFPGDGHKMGLWVGAAWQRTYPNAAMVDNLNGPYSNCISNVTTINLNKEGKRFMNEDTLCSYSAWATKQQTDKTVYYIWDSEYVNHYDRWYTFGCTLDDDNGPKGRSQEEELADWEEMVKNGVYVKADTLEELVGQLDGLDGEAALETLAKYNEYCDNGYDPEFLKNAAELAPIKTGPFYGYKYEVNSANFLCVTGGLRTNENMQVCEEDDTPIEGLYNVGIMVGDMYANCYNFAICGHNLSSCCNTFPYMLGRDLANM